jgi:hypothetical protein
MTAGAQLNPSDILDAGIYSLVCSLGDFRIFFVIEGTPKLWMKKGQLM